MESDPVPLNSEPASIPVPAEVDPAGREIKTCWVCQQDDVDDETPDVIWKSPCPCSLVAHDTCLLDWIADKERPRKGEIARNKEIKCPQCQAVLNIQRPRDYLVQVYDLIHRAAVDCAVPTALSGLVGCLYSGFLVYGLNTMQTVFGFEEARRVLGGVFVTEPIGQQWMRLIKTSLRWSLTAFDPFFPDYKSTSNWKIFLGLPLIGPSLIISRSRFADQAFAMVLPAYFLDPAHRNLVWPPSPGLAFSTLPYMRSAYNELYRLTITPHEKRWDAAVQRTPREGETAADVAAEARQQEEAGAVFQIEIVQDEFEEVEEAQADDDGPPQHEMDRAELQAIVEAVEAAQPRVVAEEMPGLVPQAGDAVPANAEIVIAPAPNANAPRPNNGGWEIPAHTSTSSIINLAMGALFFPTVAAAMGDILKYTLPASWVGNSVGVRYAGRYQHGLLKEKWGRTLVGGCLFVVLKDMVTLYCKWKKARDFGKRTVMNYVGERRRG